MSLIACCPSKTILFSAAAVKNQETGHLFLNDEDELPESRVVIEKGVAWEYDHTEEQESVTTTGPLKYGVLLMVSQQHLLQSKRGHGRTSEKLSQNNHALLCFLCIRSVPMVSPR